MHKIIICNTGTAEFLQQVVLAFSEEGINTRFLTSVCIKNSNFWLRVLDEIPTAYTKNIQDLFLRRLITEFPNVEIRQRPWWELLRSIASRLGADRRLVDWIWDQQSHDFTRWASREIYDFRPKICYAYEYTAYEAFVACDRVGCLKVLDLSAPSSRAFNRLLKQEYAAYPETVQDGEEYFERRFSIRQARRDKEVQLADVVICNSSVTKDSHVEDGCDPKKCIVVPLAAPKPVEIIQPPALHNTMRIIWAGNFSVRKGAHYALEALRSFSKNNVVMHVYGSVLLPQNALARCKDNIEFFGSVIKYQLFSAMEKSDVLLFPTLSDGFGLVVMEAFACGLPVITTKSAGASDFVVHMRNGLMVKECDSTSIRDGISWCLDNRSMLAEMRQNALNTARARQWVDYRRDLRLAVSSYI